MKRTNFVWIYLFGFGGLLIGVSVTSLCSSRISDRVFGSGSYVIWAYSVGLFLWSTGWVNYFWGQRISALEAKLAGIGATSPASVAPTATQGVFTVSLKSYPANKKVTLIKVIREITGLGLKQAKDLVDGVPCTFKAGASNIDMEVITTKLADTGADVEVK